MNTIKIIITILTLFFSSLLYAQKSDIYTDELRVFNHAIALYNNKDYVASQQLFAKVSSQFDANSENKATCDYYIAFIALHLNDRNGGAMMTDFVQNYPTSTKRNDAYREVSNYYYDYGKYNDALKWFKHVDTKGLTRRQEEDFNFKYGYALFNAKSYKKAKNYFAPLLESPKYGAQAKYYYGFMAYQEDDFNNADKYLGEIANNEKLGKDVPYFQASIKFKLGKFQEAINIAEPFLQNANRKQKSDVSKIIGESYFNLGNYAKAIPHLKNYKGNRNKWNNTDYYQLGYAYYKQNDYENAISWFNKIIDGKSAVSQNASYHIAECYIKLDKKQEALTAFKNAIELDHNNDIKKNAWLNYAKLSYEIGNPYKSVPDVLTDYMQKYPKSEAKEVINDLLISSYVTSKDFEGAIKLLKKKNDKKSKEIYQKVTFYRGIQLFNDADFKEATILFDTSLENKLDPIFTARATYWKAESNYLQHKYKEALFGFSEFLSLEKAVETEEYKTIDYNLAYANFKLKNYTKSITYFKNYTENYTEKTAATNDSYLRLGDSYFITSNYWKAIEAYNTAITNKAKNLDYAHFQKAISYGFVGKNTEKINELNTFLDHHKSSKLRDDAYFNLGNAYKKENDEQNALDAYQNVIDKHKRSALVPKALLKQGLIYFNSQRGKEALVKYKQLVRDYQQTPESRQAVNNARQIYINLGQVDEYAIWVKTIDFVEISDNELDNDMYESADIQYQQNNKKKAIEGFKKYLAQFPNGLNTLQAHFYLAEMYYSNEKFEMTKPHYKFIINQDTNEYTEQALTRLSQIFLNDLDWVNAIPLLKRLEQEAKTSQNIVYAQRNLMKGNYQLEKYSNAVAFAEKVLQHTNLENRIKIDAKIIIARVAIKTADFEKARTTYEEVSLTAQGKLKAEAIYYDAHFKNKDGDYKNSNKQVQTLASEYATYKVWGVKGLVIMAKNFYGLEDAYQATLILETVIKNYRDKEEHKEAVDEAKIELQKIKVKEAKTNNSVLPE
ncbi:MAG: tetratricopeptide repeat protein [Flavobacteriaceae bacterium]|nr:tetratricopeptide repeat protein [Flavobacteriaceae bacterium]